MTHNADSDVRCAEHGDHLVWELGGDDMPTIYGRWYCPTCQELFAQALDQLATEGEGRQ
jgi:hypothetical protein